MDFLLRFLADAVKMSAVGCCCVEDVAGRFLGGRPDSPPRSLGVEDEEADEEKELFGVPEFFLTVILVAEEGRLTIEGEAFSLAAGFVVADAGGVDEGMDEPVVLNRLISSAFLPLTAMFFSLSRLRNSVTVRDSISAASGGTAAAVAPSKATCTAAAGAIMLSLRD